MIKGSSSPASRLDSPLENTFCGLFTQWTPEIKVTGDGHQERAHLVALEQPLNVALAFAQRFVGKWLTERQVAPLDGDTKEGGERLSAAGTDRAEYLRQLNIAGRCISVNLPLPTSPPPHRPSHTSPYLNYFQTTLCKTHTHTHTPDSLSCTHTHIQCCVYRPFLLIFRSGRQGRGRRHMTHHACLLMWKSICFLLRFRFMDVQFIVSVCVFAIYMNESFAFLFEKFF